MNNLSFNLDLYQSAWHDINQAQILATQSNLEKPITLSVFDSIPSTNTKLWELIDCGIDYPAGAIALQQTAGKGQWGHSWISATGGLYLSVALDLDLELANYPHLVIATVWGVATILRHFQLPVTIKWSNDLILHNRKLGGIKIETRNLKHKLNQAVIGVGINWCNYVPEPGINLKSYYQNQGNQTITTLEELTAITSYGILLGYEYYLTVGIEKILTEYLAIFHNLGQKINFNGAIGEVIGITTTGKLKVKMRSPGATTEIVLSPGQISLGY